MLFLKKYQYFVDVTLDKSEKGTTMRDESNKNFPKKMGFKKKMTQLAQPDFVQDRDQVDDDEPLDLTASAIAQEAHIDWLSSHFSELLEKHCGSFIVVYSVYDNNETPLTKIFTDRSSAEDFVDTLPFKSSSSAVCHPLIQHVCPAMFPA